MQLCADGSPLARLACILERGQLVLSASSVMGPRTYFRDDDDVDNVTLQLWKFSDFSSRHTVGVAGDDLMCHILVDQSWTV